MAPIAINGRVPDFRMILEMLSTEYQGGIAVLKFFAGPAFEQHPHARAGTRWFPKANARSRYNFWKRRKDYM